MNCYFINLDEAKERRNYVENSFRMASPKRWTLHRFKATASNDATAMPGLLTNAQKACFCSHRELIRANANSNEPTFVAEDDIRFSKQTFDVIDRIISHDSDWDIIFTDVLLPDLSTMIDLIRRRQSLVENRQFAMFDLRDTNFASASAYIVNGRAKKALIEFLDEEKTLDTPFDLYLRKICYLRKLKMLYVFPFITTLSLFADSSQIDSNLDIKSYDHIRIWNLFRRFMWVERDVDDCVDYISNNTELNQNKCDYVTGVIMSSILASYKE